MKTREAVGAIIQKDNKYLLVNKISTSDIRQALPDNGIWDFPKGGVAIGESQLETLYRELKEELSITKFKVICRLSKSLYFQFPKAVYKETQYKDQITTFYYVKLEGETENIIVDGIEIYDFKFFPEDKVVDVLTHKETQEYFLWFLNNKK